MTESTSGPPPDPVPWRRLAGDTLVRIAVVTLVAAGLPLWVPSLSQAWKARYAFFVDTPMLLLTVVACSLALRRAATARERRFWGLFALAFMSWLLVRGADAVARPLLEPVSASLLRDLLYVGFYLFFILALEGLPHERPRDPQRRLVRETEAAGAIAFTFGLLVYFSVIPSAVNPESFLSLVPSTLLFVILDAYLVARVAILFGYARDPGWRLVYAGLAVTTGLFVVLDGLDLMSRIEGVPGIPLGSPLEVLWLLPNVTMIATTRLGVRRQNEAEPSTRAPDDSFALLWRGRLAYYALALAMLHLGAETAGLIDAPTRAPRQWCVLITLAALVALSAVYDRRLAAQHRRLEDDHRRISEQLETAQRMDAVRRLAGGMAHDFNNMLTVIQGHAELLLAAHPTGGRGREDAEQVLHAASRASALTEQLLAMSRRPRRSQDSFLPGEAILSARPMLERLVGEDLSLRIELDSKQPALRGDAAAFTDCVVNLVINARDACSSGDWIAIRTGSSELRGDAAVAHGVAAGHYGVIEVSDSGKGMDEITRRHVFEPFFTTKSRGTGLGLSTVYSFATEAGGGVEVTSREGLGTTFRMLLPLTSPLSEQDAEAEPGALAPGKRGTILVAEDESGVRKVVSAMLVHAGYEVVLAADGQQALEILHQGTEFDLVLTDVVMPRLGGAALAERVHRERPAVPIVFMTGYADDRLQTLGQWARSAPVLTKPFSRDKLVETVAAALDRSKLTSR